MLKVKNIRKYFPLRKEKFFSPRQYVRAVDGVSFSIAPGKTLGLVGESGSGKTTLGRIILKLIEATSGEVYFKDKEILGLTESVFRPYRKKMQIVFQDPYGSLNPRLRTRDILEEALVIHHLGKKNKRSERVAELLDLVGISPRHMNRYPHEFSGGQRQRISIARALAVNPEFIVADEPVSALDVSIQAQILNLLKDLQEKLKLTFLFIAHDLSVVKHISDEIAVMYLGKIMEQASAEELFSRPLHPYTQALLAAIPSPDPEKKRAEGFLLKEDVSSEALSFRGCRFHPRCPKVMGKCKEKEPELNFEAKNHAVACHFL